MNNLFFIITLCSMFFNSNHRTSTENIKAEEVAAKFCNCGQQNNLAVTAKAYLDAKSTEAKESAKTAYALSLRNVQQCVNVNEVQLAVRKLPRDQRVQFEKNVQKILTETCGEIANALRILK
jgi:hypothetical protein